MRYEGELRDAVVVAVDVVLRLLDVAERRQSFPRGGGSTSDIDVDNEQRRLEAIQEERRRYQELRSRVHGDEIHGVPVLTEGLESALGLVPTVFEDEDGDDAYASYLQDLEEQGADQSPTSTRPPGG